MAKSKYFNIEGIQKPGRCQIVQFGIVKLFEADDEMLWKIYKQGFCQYLQLTAAGHKKYFPERKVIKTEAIKAPVNKNIKKTRSTNTPGT